MRRLCRVPVPPAGPFGGAFGRGTAIWSSEMRVYGGCLGMFRRRRPRQAAKSGGEGQTPFDPPVAEWGNPSGAIPTFRPERIGAGGRTRRTEPSK